jgi:hypothetical protein
LLQVFLGLPRHGWCIRILHFEPIRRTPRPVSRILPLRHDAFEAHLASMGKDGRTATIRTGPRWLLRAGDVSPRGHAVSPRTCMRPRSFLATGAASPSRALSHSSEREQNISNHPYRDSLSLSSRWRVRLLVLRFTEAESLPLLSPRGETVRLKPL